MKKKFVLTLALALIVAASLVAAPVTLTGSFEAGYKMVYNNGALSSDAENSPEINTNGLALSGDFWKVSVGSDLFTFGDDNAVKGSIDIYLDKALAEQGVDMGDITLTAEIGNMISLTPFYVYANSNGVMDDSYELEMAGTGYSSALTIGYGSLATVYVGADLAPVGNAPVVAAVKVMPADGVSATASYATVATDSPLDGAVAGSVCVDVAKLAGLDFGLKASAYDIYYFDSDKNYMFAEASASYDMVSAWVEYSLLDGDSDITAKATVALLDNVSVYAKGATLLSDSTFYVGANADYVMGGVTYNLDAELDITNTSLTVKPYVSLSF